SAFHISCMMGTCGSHQLPTQIVTDPLGCAETPPEPAARSAAARAGPTRIRPNFRRVIAIRFLPDGIVAAAATLLLEMCPRLVAGHRGRKNRALATSLQSVATLVKAIRQRLRIGSAFRRICELVPNPQLA